MKPIPILLYHTVSDEVSGAIVPFNVRPRSFRHHLDLIVDSGRTAITVSRFVDALMGRSALPERPVILTFDDGYADFAGTAAPALAARGLTGTIYLTTGMLRGRRPSMPGPARMLDWHQLSELAGQGIEIGAHAHTHPELDLMPPGRADAEIRTCKRLLEDELGHAIASFAYPYGLSSGRLRRMVRDAGYVSACSVKNAFSSPSDSRYALARLTVFAHSTPDTLRDWLAGTGARTITIGRDGPYTVGRRLARRVRAWSVSTEEGAP